MAPLTKDRNTPQSMGTRRSAMVAAAATLFGGSLICRNAAGFAVSGATAVGLVGIGVAQSRADNAQGADGDMAVPYEAGVWSFASAGGADEITAADVGKLCFVVDDQTVAKTDGTGTRSPAGFIDKVDDTGVGVRFDEALTLTAAAAAA